MSNSNYRQDRRGEVWTMWDSLYLIVEPGIVCSAVYGVPGKNLHWINHRALQLESGKFVVIVEHESNNLEMSSMHKRVE